MGYTYKVRHCVGHAPFRSRFHKLTRCTHKSDRMESLAFGRAWQRSRHLRLHPDIRPHEGRSRWFYRKTTLSHNTASVEPYWKSVPSRHILCNMTASLRATAIMAQR